MTDQDFIARGFSEFPPTAIDHKGVIKCFQKRYDNKIGKKYFITVRKWDEWKHPYTGEVWPCTYEYDVQLYSKGKHDAVDLTFHSSWTLDDVERHMEHLFATGLYDYYEEW